MSSLAEELSQLLNPHPVLYDPEEDIFEDTKAKLVDKDGLNDIKDDEHIYNHLGNKKMQSLESMGPLYAGRVATRDGDDISDDDNKDSVVSEEDITFSDEGQYQGHHTESIENSNCQSEEENSMLDIDDEEIDSDQAMGDENLEVFKQREGNNPRIKGISTQNQISLWENMLELRIKSQKMLSIANQLPQGSIMKMFEEQLKDSVEATDHSVSALLYKLGKLEMALLSQNPQTCSEERIKHAIKRKNTASSEELDSLLQGRFVDVRERGNKIMKMWYDKTRLTSSTAVNANKSFSSFEKSTVAQINDILRDKERLIKRTQLQRMNYRVLGTEKVYAEHENNTDHSSHLKKFDSETFDDDDFYHHLLRQLIEQKASAAGGSSDPLELTRQWLKIQRLRGKANRNVDTKASKGRKIRYEIHQKLVSFLAPNDQSNFTHDARNQLFRSLFGKSLFKDALFS